MLQRIVGFNLLGLNLPQVSRRGRAAYKYANEGDMVMSDHKIKIKVKRVRKPRSDKFSILFRLKKYTILVLKLLYSVKQ